MRSSKLCVGLDTALRGLADLERERAQLHRREVGQLIASHRGAGQYVAGGAPGSERMHGLDSRGDTWVDGTDVAVAELAPSRPNASFLSMDFMMPYGLPEPPS